MKPCMADGQSESILGDLRLLQLADSALPIGALAHSFGVESLVAAGFLRVPDLPGFLSAYVSESGFAEAVFCREAFALAIAYPAASAGFLPLWLRLNHRLSALKPAREAREASASLGRNFLRTVVAIHDLPLLREAFAESVARRPSAASSPAHHCAAFGLAAAVLGFSVESAAAAYLHQAAAGLVSACQRLLPLGQTEAARILWDLKPAIMDAVARSAACPVKDVHCFTPLLDCGAMEHPALATRLFIS